jgi:cytochrome c biogenesis protein CcmG, thiol:disulfide interchange protein DsbE
VSRVPRAAAVVAGLAAALAAGACGEAAPPESSTGREPAPAYAAVTLDGDSVSLAGLRGQAVLLNVWATWCAPCRVEIPELQHLHEELGDRGLRVVGVTVDSRAAMNDVRRFMDEFGMTYDVWWDPDHRVLNAFGGAGVPLTVLMDRDGLVEWRHLGMFERGDPDLLAALERVLGE